MSDACCPHCRSTELLLVGAVLLNPEGYPYRKGLRLSDFDTKHISVSREYLRCKACGKEFKADDARKASGEDVEDATWELTEHGVRVPVICPVCDNRSHFVRTVLELVRKDEDVLIKDGEPELQFVGGNVAVDHRAVLEYKCGAEECEGTVQLFTNDFHIVHSP